MSDSHDFWCASNTSQLCKGPRVTGKCNCKRRQTMADTLHGTVRVNREALRDLLRRADPGGFQSGALGITFAADGNGIFTILVEDDHVHDYIDRALASEPGPLLVCGCGSVKQIGERIIG